MKKSAVNMILRQLPGLLIALFTASTAHASHLIAGSDTATVQVLIFGDFQCPPTRLQIENVETLNSLYGNRIGIHFSSFPIPTHPEGRPAAIATECAGQQGKYLPFFKAMFSNQSLLGEKFYLETAKSIGIQSLRKFQACLKSPEISKQIDEEFAGGVATGVYGTPINYINGQRVLGPDLDSMKLTIEDALTKDPWAPH